jgi:rhamnose transport system permease protein
METSRIATEKNWNAKSFFLQWEWLLIILLLLIHGVNSLVSPYYFSLDTFLSTPMTFLDKAFIVFPMMFVLISGNGNIDISVASTVALSSVIMGVSYNHGLPMGAALVLCLCVATVCGLINGILLAVFPELPAMIVTLSTMTLYRGIAYIILEDKAAGKFPAWFSYFGWGYIGPVPFILVMFILAAVTYGILLHRTPFGRSLYAMGNNRKASLYSGIRINRITVIIYMLAGFMSGITAIFLTSRMGNTRPNIANNYELDVIAMAVLGGVSTAGGKGRILGPVISIFIIGYLQYGLGLINQSAQVVMIILGILLIASILVQGFDLDKKQGMVHEK